VTAAVAICVLATAPLAPAAGAPPADLRLTSITVDPEGPDGATTNAPGAWSTNTGDPLCQVGVWDQHGLLNSPVGTNDLGEISVPLKPGKIKLQLIGNGIFPANPYYGAVLFFEGQATPPQIAVYNANGGTGAFQVQAAGTQIMGGANGGLFFDVAPGTSVYTANGFQVSVEKFEINASDSTTDHVSCGGTGANSTPDMVATLDLKVRPAK
jgi:hypothetical protein